MTEEAHMTDDDLIETFLAAQAAFTERVHAVAGEQWPAATPTRSGPWPT